MFRLRGIRWREVSLVVRIHEGPLKLVVVTCNLKKQAAMRVGSWEFFLFLREERISLSVVESSRLTYRRIVGVVLLPAVVVVASILRQRTANVQDDEHSERNHHVGNRRSGHVATAVFAVALNFEEMKSSRD